MIEKVHLGILVSKSQSMVMFPMTNKKGSVRGGGRKEEEEVKIDMNSGFYSTDGIFHEWYLDYFNYMWQIAKPFNPKRLSEV
jgi:hypothetical protein